MAFTFAPNWTSAKYRYSFTGDEGTSYIWEIHEDGHNNGGSPTNIDASGRDNCVTSWKNADDDEYSPLMTSETKVSLFDPSLNVINDLLDALSTGSISDVEEKYRLVVRSGNNLKWVGNIDPEGITYEEDGATQLNITATDGIGRLANKPYITDTATGALPDGIDSIKNIFVELLDYTGFDLDIYMSSSFYPKAMYSLPSDGVNSNPLEYIYANKYHFRDVKGINDGVAAWSIAAQEVLSSQGFLDPGDIDEDDRPISIHSALVGLLKSFGLRIVQQDGTWHIIQCNHLAKATTYKRWKYDSTGAAIGDPNYEDVTSGLSISNITVARTRSRVSTLPSYSSSVVTYAHGSSNMIRLGQFGNITKARGAYSTTYPWTAGNASLSARADRDGGFSGWQIADVNEDPTQKTGFTRIDDFPGVFNFNDSSGSFTTSIGGRTASQTTNIESQSGDKLNLQFEVFVAPKGVTVGSFDLLGRETPEISGDAFVAVQVKLNTSTPRYLELIEPRAGEWTTTPTWMSWSWLSLQNWNPIFVTSNAVPSDATITVTLGPVFDGKGNQAGSCYYQNVALYPVVSDSAISFTATSYVNYIDRSDPRPRQHSVKFGDGPTAYTSGALYTASNRSAFTADWEEVLNTGGSASGHSGADTNEEIAVVLGRAILKSTNRIRTVHDRAFNGAGQILLPLDVIIDGSRYAPHSLDANWVEEYSSGSWIKLDENGFTDDLETGIKSGGSSLSSWGRGTGYNSGLVLNGLQQSFISDNSKRITRTTAVIPAGNATDSVAVEEIAEPLLNDNDTIVIISPTLEWYRVKIKQDQLATATEIFFDDPDSPGSNFDFPNKIPAGANIFVADDELLTLVRTGAQGFAVTVLGQDLGTVNEGSGGSASYTDIDVTDWNTTVRTGSTIEVQQTDGSYVTAQLWDDAYKGATNIQITLPGEPDVQTSITMDLTSGKKISPTGSVSRADFTVTADAITSYISTDGDLIATIDTPATSGTSVSTDTPLTSTLKAGDTVYFHGANTGRVFKRTVATVTGTDFTITSAFGGDDIVAVGDYVFGGTLVGMRIDADGVDFVNTHIKSDNWASSGGVIDDDPTSATYGEITMNGAAGWVITKSGEAEFANLTVRGTLSTLEGTIGVGTSGVLGRSVDGGEFLVDADGLFLLYDQAGDYDVADAATIVFANENKNNRTEIGYAAEQDPVALTWSPVEWHIDSYYPIDISTTASNANISLTPHGTGQIILDYASFPAADGTSGQVLTTNGSGTLSWSSAGSGSGTVTEVISGTGSGIDVTLATTTPTLVLNLDELSTGTIASFSGVSAAGDTVNQAIGNIGLSSFNNDSGFTSNSGTVTQVISGLGSGIDVSSATTTPTLVLNLDELSTGTIASFSGVSTAGDTVNQAIGGINISGFNNDAGYTSNAGTVTSVISGTGSGIDVSSATTTPTLVLNLDELSAGTITSFAGVSLAGDTIIQALSGISLSSFNDDLSYASPGDNISIFTNNSGYITGISNLTDIGDVSGTPADKHIIYYDAGGPGWASQTLASALTDQNVSSLINDAGYTTNIGDITGVTTGATSGLDGGATSGTATLSLDFSRLTAGAVGDLTGGTIAFATSGGNMRKIAASNLLFETDGVTGTFYDTEFQTVDGGTQTEYRQRTVTVTDGQITAFGTFGAWESVAVA